MSTQVRSQTPIRWCYRRPNPLRVVWRFSLLDVLDYQESREVRRPVMQVPFGFLELADYLAKLFDTVIVQCPDRRVEWPWVPVEHRFSNSWRRARPPEGLSDHCHTEQRAFSPRICLRREAKQSIICTSVQMMDCLLYTSPSPRDRTRSRMPSSA